MSKHALLAVLCAVALASLLPRGARAFDTNLSGSNQTDYFYVPETRAQPNPRANELDGFTNELSLKVAVDLNAHLSANVKVCMGCHGFELPMAYVDLRVADELNFRVGRFNPAFGEFYLRADVGNHRTSDRPLPYDMGRMLYLFQFNRSVLPMPYVENGIEVSGTHFFGSRAQVDYAAHVVTGLRANDPTPYDVEFAAMRQPAPYYVDNNSQPAVGGRLSTTIRLTDRTDITLGASGIYGTYDPNARFSYTILGVDAFLHLGRTNIRAEYLLRRTEMAAGEQDRFVGVVPRGPDGQLVDRLPFVKDGWYVELEQPISRHVDAVLRWDGIHRVGNTAPGSPLAFDAGMMRWTLGTNFAIVRGYRIKASVEYHYVWGVEGAPPGALGFHISAVATF